MNGYYMNGIDRGRVQRPCTRLIIRCLHGRISLRRVVRLLDLLLLIRVTRHLLPAIRRIRFIGWRSISILAPRSVAIRLRVIALVVRLPSNNSRNTRIPIRVGAGCCIIPVVVVLIGWRSIRSCVSGLRDVSSRGRVLGLRSISGLRDDGRLRLRLGLLWLSLLLVLRLLLLLLLSRILAAGFAGARVRGANGQPSAWLRGCKEGGRPVSLFSNRAAGIPRVGWRDC